MHGTIFFVAASQLPFAVGLMKNVMDGVAKELEEAVRTDGASSLPSLARIVLPLTGPGVAVVVHSTPVIPLYVLISRRLGAGFAPGGAVKG